MSVVILDDHFPALTTGFRVAEYNWLMRHNVVANVYTTAEPWLHLRDRYREAFPDLGGRVQKYQLDSLAGASAVYMTFLNNADHYLPALIERQLPFVVELYPGGGLHVGDPLVDSKMSAICESGLLRGIIVTNHRVLRWLKLNHASAAPIAFVPGVVVDPALLAPGPGLRQDYPQDANATVKLAFVAHKYSSDGRDKGFPDFAETVSILTNSDLRIEAHVVGDFQPSDLPSHVPADNFTFHGLLTAPMLKRTLTEMHIVLSLNRPGVLHEYQFDGFPTASVISASLCGAAIVATDHYGENRDYIEGRDIIVIPDDAAHAADVIYDLVSGGRVHSVAQFGLRASRRRFGLASQMLPRKAALESFLA